MTELTAYSMSDHYNPSEQLQKAIIIEDSPSNNGFYSLFHDRYIGEVMENGIVVLYWKNPTYQIPDQISLVRYEHGVRHGRLTKEQIELEHVSEAIEASKSSLNSYMGRPISKLPNLRFWNCHIGIGVTSELANTIPEYIASDGAIDHRVVEPVKCIIHSFITLKALTHRFEIKQFFATEHTYRIGGLLEYAVHLGIQCPFSLEGFPFCLRELNNIEKIYEPRIGFGLAVEKHILSLSRPRCSETEQVGRIALRQRLKHVAKTGISQDKINESSFALEEIASELNLPVVTEIPWREKRQGEYEILIYAHAISDGLFSGGYDGFITPYAFFAEVIRALKGIRSKKIYIRIHPAITRSSHYDIRTKQMFNGDIFYFKHFIQVLVEELKLDPVLVSPRTALVKLLKCKEIIHVTHFGTVAMETLFAGKPTLYSHMAPYAGLGVGGLMVTKERLASGITVDDVIAAPINADMAAKYIGALSNNYDMHISRRDWIAKWAIDYGFDEELSLYLEVCANEDLRSALKKTTEYEYVYTKYLSPWKSGIKSIPQY